MPLTRYQIRNEFNLADPDLYRASDKDDPEALLEGVAMAGLVGVLRQLGDLAEFAAEIFHDLHEEVMATSARGHGLMARIQQLEADVPSIENNLLSQTNHTAFYYNTGVDWHPQMCTDQNLITQGDMPRFIRDSYEECRGPPQLFLLDKFDIGGAGACLKRYSDPSFFKAEPTPSDAAKLETQRDRRTRKIKKKGSHWRNGDTPEVLTTSHAKLHQLLLEERIGNDSKVPARLVKLKKRILDDSKCSKSYMEKFLQTMSPEHSEIHEIEVGQPTLRLTYNYIDDSEREILDIQPVSAAKDSPYVSPTNQETKLRPSVMYSYDFNKSRRSKGSTVSVEDGNTIGIASPLHISVTEKELGVDGENRHGNGIISSYSDDIASETESYLDALANMESEADTDNEYISKKELDMDSHSHLIPPADDHVGNNHAIVLKDVIARSASGEILNGFKHSVDSAPETYGSFLVKTDAAPFFEVNADDDDSLYTIKRELAETRDSEGHVSSFQRVLVDDVAVESNFGCKNDYDLAILPAGSYSPSRNRNSSQISISSSDDLHHGGVQSEGLSSPRYLVNAELRSELNDLEDFKRGLAVRFEQSDQGMEPLDAIVSYSVDNQATHRLHTDSSTNSTSLRGKDHNPELANHLPSHFDASSFTPSSEELLFCQEEAVLKMPEPHCGQFPTSAVDFSTQDNSMKLDSDEEVIFQPDSIAQKFGDPQIEREVNLEGAPALPPLPPMQWRVGKPQDLFFDSEGESEEFTVASKGSLSPIAFGLKGSLHFTPLNGESKQPFTATQTEESSPHIPRDCPGGFPLPTDSMLQVKDTIDVHGQHSLLTSEKLQTDSAVNYLLESGQPDTLAFIGETPKPSSGSYLPTSSPDTDSFTMEAIQPGYGSQYSLGDMNTHTKDTIQPKPAEHTLSTGETTQLCATLESPQPPLGDTVVSLSSASEVPMHSTDQSLEELNSYSRTEHETQNDEKKIIKCLEVPGPHIKNEEHPKPEMKSLEREATWSLNETQNDEKKIIKCLEVPGPHIKNEEHPKPETKSLEREAKWSLALLNYEEEKLAERPAVKPPRPRNPLIESIDALDRSKLKKVTARTRRETPTVDDRGSLLEQIRTKSFNLKPAPAPVAKPIIQAPSMNLKVAAILEKANKIRRATAGSDEDEDEWSDD